MGENEDWARGDTATASIQLLGGSVAPVECIDWDFSFLSEISFPSAR